jgi:hypothetical protein
VRRQHLSKSRFVAGQQCDKLLWLKVHERNAPELVPDADLQALFDRGNRIGELARTLVPGGTLIALDPRRRQHAVAATQAALQAGASVLYEASFEQDDTFVAVDILERTDAGWVVIEVKSSRAVMPQHIIDLAVQMHVVQRAGLKVVRAELMHLNPKHRHPDTGPLFIRADVTEAVAKRVRIVKPALQRQLRVLQSADCPDVEPGNHCYRPYTCPFEKRCCVAAPAHDVSELYELRHAGGHEPLREQGYANIADLPDAIPLPQVADRQRRAVKTGALVVEPGLAEALAELRSPRAYLDFETINFTLPVWNGCAPSQNLPVQFSVHREEPDGSVSQHAFLAEGPDDPRRALTEKLLALTAPAATVLAWYAKFERDRILELADAFPDLAPPLHNLSAKLVDLLPIVRGHVYHPDFRGHFGLKIVVPALLPELSYSTLEIKDGMTASGLLKDLLFTPETFTEQAQTDLRRDLLRYCGHDTHVLVHLVRYLERAAHRAHERPGLANCCASVRGERSVA